jgi:hypothetical protein
VPRKKVVEVDAEEDLFARAIAGAKPLHGDPRGVVKPDLPPPNADHLPHYDEDAAVYEHLLDHRRLCRGSGSPDPAGAQAGRLRLPRAPRSARDAA